MPPEVESIPGAVPSSHGPSASSQVSVTHTTPGPESAPAPLAIDAAAAVTSGHHLLHQSEHADDGVDVPGSTHGSGISDGVPRSIALRLYVSHFLSTWNSRLFEFGAALFLTSVFPGTLLPVSIYSLVRNAGYILFAQPMGQWINTGNRLNIIRTSIVGQRIPVAASCGLLLVLELKGSELGYRKDDGIFAVIVFLAVVEKLCSTVSILCAVLGISSYFLLQDSKPQTCSSE